jgi:glycosyltransferase involved in cell wall biosynthesis
MQAAGLTVHGQAFALTRDPMTDKGRDGEGGIVSAGVSVDADAPGDLLPARPLKVVLIYRRRSPDGFSIEQLFHTVAGELASKAEIIEYETGGRLQAFADAMRLRRLYADVYHVTGDITYLALLLPRRKTVVTIHDIGNFLFGLRGLKRWLYKWVWLVLPIRRSAATTAVSQETRDHIERHLGIPGGRVRVVENCHRPIFRPVARPFAAECPVVLQVGTKHYKNVPRLIEALTGLNVRLVLVGRLDGSMKAALEKSRIVYENHVGISNEALYNLYVGCDVVSFVSIGEGFGLPIIEAQAVGRIVVTANIPPMSVVAGDGACLVDPLDITSMRAGFERIFADANYRRELAEAARANVVRFSPARIGAEYLALYREVARP